MLDDTIQGRGQWVGLGGVAGGQQEVLLPGHTGAHVAVAAVRHYTGVEETPRRLNQLFAFRQIR